MEIALLNVNHVYVFIFVLHRIIYRTGNNSRKITLYLIKNVLVFLMAWHGFVCL